MTAFAQFDLPARSAGFLSDPSKISLGQGVRLTAFFDQNRFRTSLFREMGIEEPAALSTWLPRRQAEFLAGRCLTRIAQQSLGFAAQPVRIARSRAPVWPHGLAGALTHSAETCACLVVLPGCGQPGIDVEPLATGSKLAALQSKALTAQERALMAKSGDPAQFATLCFSAKETLFKALFPTVGRFFGFDCAETVAPPTASHITLALTSMLHPSLPRGLCFDIGYEISAMGVMTWTIHVPG